MQCNSTRFTTGTFLNFLGFITNYPACRPAACKKFQQSQLGCAWTYLREIFNEITTGICVCATGLYRYLLVCHPSYKVEDTFYKKGAFVIAAILILEIIAITADLAFNNTYEYIDFAGANYRFQIHNTKTIS